MSHRREDATLLEYVRTLDARLRRLEGPDKGVRQNDLRIGNQLIQEGSDDNSLTVMDLRTRRQFALPADPVLTEASFSWGGKAQLVVTNPTYNVSPKYYLDRNVVLNELVWTAGGTEAVGTNTYSISLNVYNAGVAQYTQAFSRTGDGTTMAQPYLTNLSVPVSAGSEIAVELVVDGSPAFMYNLAVTVKWTVV